MIECIKSQYSGVGSFILMEIKALLSTMQAEYKIYQNIFSILKRTGLNQSLHPEIVIPFCLNQEY